MNKKILPILCAIALQAAAAYAVETTGSIELDGKLTSIQGQKAKFNEYLEHGSGINANFFLDVGGLESQDLTFQFEGLGYNADSKDQRNNADIQLHYNNYENYKFNFYLNHLPHNYTYGAKTFLTGLGTPTLSGTPTTTPATWASTFDYKVDRNNIGAATELSFKSPFFFGVKYDRTTQTGLYPLAINANSSFTEFPAAIDTATDSIFLEGGYRSNKIIFKVDGLISSFTQYNPWTTVQGGTTPIIGLGPSSDYYKVGSSLMVHLPLNSSLMARGNYSILKNDMDLTKSGTLTAPQYHGEITNTTASVALASNPIAPLETRLFYNVLNRHNGSTAPFVYLSADGVANRARTTGNFEFGQQNAGIDASYKLPAKTKVAGGYEYVTISRADSNTPATTTSYYGNSRLSNQDHIVFVEAKNSYLESVSAKVRYQHLKRSGGTWTSDKMLAPTAGNENLPPQMRPFDAADKTQDSVKLAFEIEPMHNLDLGIEYLYKQNDYSNTRFGITNDKRHEVYLDANYKFSIVNLNAFFDFERVESDLSQKVGNSLTISTTTFNWSALRRDDNYAAGTKIDVDIIKNVLRASAGYRYEKSDGSSDFTNKNGTVALQDIPYVESTNRHSLTADVNYKINKSIDVTCGYAYDKLRYNDWQLDNYSYVVPGTTAINGGYASGAYANPNYDAHLGHITVAYKF